MANIKKLPLFCRCVIQNFPFIEEDFDALTNYELICKVVKYLNKVISSQNEVIGVANNLQDAFQRLHDYVENYFDNLDVQEEINNKLDAMVEAGTLQEIITTYIQSNVAWTFDTVADMKLATNLVNGSYARTLGFHSINDGGGSLYYITDSGTANEMDVISCGNLYAHLIYGKEINVKQLGAYGDDEHDDINYINRALALSTVINIPKGTYKTSQKISITEDYTDFNCLGTIHYTGITGIEITARYSNIYIEYLIGNETVGNQALVVTCGDSTTHHNYITVNKISSSNYGICLLPINGKGILYNEFHFKNITASVVSIYFKGDDLTSTYVNENNFYGGRVGPAAGVKMEKGTSQVTKFGSNHFYHIGFEGVTEGVNLQFASSNIFRDVRMSEGLNGNYWIVCDADTYGNYFDTSSVEITKINDSTNIDNGYNTYIGHPLLRAGAYHGREMRTYRGQKLFDRSWNFNNYSPLISVYGTENATITADYYYNGMVIECGGDTDGTYVVNLPNIFGDWGIIDFYLYVKNKTSGSSLKVLNASGSTIIKTAAFPGAIEKQLFHIVRAPHFSNSYSSDWIIK